MKIAVASDHAGFRYKELIKAALTAQGHEVQDFGTHSTESVDYPDFIRPAALAVAQGLCERGIVLGGSGNGEAMVANRIRGVRCSLCWNVESARLARAHNDANVLPLGGGRSPGGGAPRVFSRRDGHRMRGGRASPGDSGDRGILRRLTPPPPATPPAGFSA